MSFAQLKLRSIRIHTHSKPIVPFPQFLIITLALDKGNNKN